MTRQTILNKPQYTEYFGFLISHLKECKECSQDNKGVYSGHINTHFNDIKLNDMSNRMSRLVKSNIVKYHSRRYTIDYEGIIKQLFEIMIKDLEPHKKTMMGQQFMKNIPNIELFARDENLQKIIKSLLQTYCEYNNPFPPGIKHRGFSLINKETTINKIFNDIIGFIVAREKRINAKNPIVQKFIIFCVDYAYLISTVHNPLLNIMGF